ncbi:gamma-glutamyltransferase family protein [Roseomonas sp. AR75]|uniref:gamma-glutamyltransferase family protein n=1 Tax=Roseomonas sp. AR75 TaxID=2562311 RepID=UPI001484FFA2|nr:gamma-glutamyltransferase [Roseomonas sp. AR75]
MSAPYRARGYATRHAAAATHHLAAQAAGRILDAGGNAVDAGVAGGLVLNVVQGEFCHFAGVAPIIVWPPGDAAPTVIAGVGPWPRRADAEHFRRAHGGRIPEGVLRTVVPAAPDAWITALARFGTMSFGEVASQAIAYAREGFRATELFCEVVREFQAGFRASPGSAAVFLPEGRLPRPGERIRMTELAATLNFLVQEERAAAARGRMAALQAARDAFYRGDIAARIAAFYAEQGGWLERDDLAAFSVPVERAVTTSAFGAEVHMCSAWSQGPVLGMALVNAAPLLPPGRDLSEPEAVHALAESFALAFADRHASFGDPDFVAVPIERLLDPAYGAERARLVQADRAFGDMPPPGVAPPKRRPAAAARWTEPELDTAFICAVDRDGGLFAATPSDGCFAGPMVPGTGLCPSSRGSQSWTDPSHPACLGPGRRPRLTTSPAMARLPDGRRMAFGTPGDDVQPQAMGQVLLRIAREGMAAQDAVEAPRFATMSFPRSSDPHEHFPGRVAIEARYGEAVLGWMRRAGHQVAPWAAWDWRAGSVGVVITDAAGSIEAAADPRRPSGVSAR